MRRRLGDERGATLVLMAFVMIILLASAGLVVNVGLVRADRQRNKSVADVAVSAGMRAFDAGGGQIAPFRGACAALDYVKTNHPELSGLSTSTGWTSGTPTVIPGDPCATSSIYYNLICNSSPTVLQPDAARASFAWFTGTVGNVKVEVKAGYAASDMATDAFRDDDYHTDTGAADQYGCDQLAVIVTETEDAGLGRVVGASQLSSRIRSVGRVTIEDKFEAAVALLLLDPTGCAVLDIQGGGAGTNVRVDG
ncbi:MAG: pilus assembly protein TadG-related protein, partial [Actinomycetota bacterium]|nr:pilus assembly protein TadG-related protein [Actinomycetota bacterium]